jgi:hypothetical protein
MKDRQAENGRERLSSSEVELDECGLHEESAGSRSLPNANGRTHRNAE